MLKKIIKWWLSSILLFLPFQRNIFNYVLTWSKSLSVIIAYLDEITIVVCLIFALIEMHKKRVNPGPYFFILAFAIMILTMAGFISGLVNNNSLYITALGTFDYIKNFLVIFIYAIFFREFNEFKTIFRIILILGIVLGIVAIVQELWALSSIYIFDKDLSDKGIYILRSLPKSIKGSTFDPWRLGMYRTPSLMKNANMFGLYILFIFTMYISIVRKINFSALGPLFMGALLSFSRMVCFSLVIVTGSQVIKGKKWFLTLLLPVVLIVLLLNLSPETRGLKFSNPLVSSEEADSFNYRKHTKIKAVEIWKDNPFWGVGPGMFGGVISIKYKSPIYEAYALEGYELYTKRYGSLDQFWPQALAETGLVGISAFAALFVSLFIIFYTLIGRSANTELDGLLRGLMIYTMVVIIYSFGSGLNVTPIIFSFAAFAGMGIGCAK